MGEVDKKMGSSESTPSITDSLGRKQYPTWINEPDLIGNMWNILKKTRIHDREEKFKQEELQESIVT